MGFRTRVQLPPGPLLKEREMLGLLAFLFFSINAFTLPIYFVKMKIVIVSKETNMKEEKTC